MLQGAERRFVRSLALLEAAWETSVLGAGKSSKTGSTLVAPCVIAFVDYIHVLNNNTVFDGTPCMMSATHDNSDRLVMSVHIFVTASSRATKTFMCDITAIAHFVMTCCEGSKLC